MATTPNPCRHGRTIPADRCPTCVREAADPVDAVAMLLGLSDLALLRVTGIAANAVRGR